MKKLLLSLLALALVMPALAQDRFSSVEERMTGKEFVSAGLDKLTAEELAALNAWLRDHSVATLDSAPGSSSAAASTSRPATGVATASSASTGDNRGLEDSGRNNDDIVSQLVGEFTGWDGETIFRLENGMVWKQAQTDKFFTRTLNGPEVTIKSGMFGAWRLSVEGYNKSVKVERIQ